MTSSNRFSNSYTNQIEQHPNIFIGTLQFVFWLFFHPSAWVNFVSTLNPDLRPDFYLAELTKQDLRKPIVRKFLFQSFVLLPLGLVLLNRISYIPLSKISILSQTYSSSISWYEYIIGIIQFIFALGICSIAFSLFLSVGAGIFFVASFQVILAIMLLLKALFILLFKFTFPVDFNHDISLAFSIGILGLIMAKMSLLSPHKNQSIKLRKQAQTIFISPLYICLFAIIPYIILILILYLVVGVIGISQGQLSTNYDTLGSAIGGKIKFQESDMLGFIIFSVICGFIYKYLFEQYFGQF